MWLRNDVKRSGRKSGKILEVAGSLDRFVTPARRLVLAGLHEEGFQ